MQLLAASLRYLAKFFELDFFSKQLCIALFAAFNFSVKVGPLLNEDSFNKQASIAPFVPFKFQEEVGTFMKFSKFVVNFLKSIEVSLIV